MAAKPKVLFISTFYPQKNLLQYCQFVHEEAKALARRGYDITVINPRQDLRSAERWTLEGIPILCLPYRTWRTNYSYIINSVFLFHALKALGRDFYLPFSFIHVHNCLPEGNAALLLKEEFGLTAPMAVQIHDPNIYKGAYIRLPLAKKLFRRRCQAIYQGFDWCLGVSGMVSDLIREGLDAVSCSKVVTSYNGYNPAIFNTVDRDGAKVCRRTVRILFVGNLIEWKGIRTLIHAYCQSYENFSVPTELWILGRGVLEKEMQKIVRSYGMEGSVSFKGYVLPEQVAAYMNQCDIYAMPSTFEAFGCVYVEAMACGLPCIACTGQGIAEIIQNDMHGLLIPPRDLDALKTALLRMVNEPDLRERFRKNIAALIPSFTWDHAVEPIAHIYQLSI